MCDAGLMIFVAVCIFHKAPVYFNKCGACNKHTGSSCGFIEPAFIFIKLGQQQVGQCYKYNGEGKE